MKFKGREFHFNLRTKLFMLIAGILLFNIILTLFFGSTLFGRLYTADKKAELRQNALELKEDYADSAESFWLQLLETEDKNMAVCMFRVGWGEISIEYYTRQNTQYSSVNETTVNKLRRFYTLRNYEGILNSNRVYFEETAEERTQDTTGYLTVFIHLGNDRFLMLETPEQYIQETAALTVRYVSLISAITFLIAVVLVFFASGSVTRPIREVQQAAERISMLNFEKKCEVRSQDEIGKLADSINHMSDRLQESISSLMDSNELLRDDLLRQEQSEQMRRRFIANVSHDFKTPLTLIVSYAEALRDTGDADEKTRQEYMNIIMEEGNKLSGLVKSLLELSRLESGSVELQRSVFSISEMLKDTVHKHQILLQKNQITVQTDLDDSLIVFADYEKIERVVSNLFENAMKYSGEQGRICLFAKQEEDVCVVRVFNSGSRIAEEDLENIFVSFYRGDKARARDGMQSYGIGLAIVKAIMDMHGQHYGVRNMPDGVEFWFDLQLADLDTDEEEIEE